MESHDKGKQAEQDNVAGNTKNKARLKILSSGNVMGNPVEQWKEVKDNRVKAVNNKKGGQSGTGKELVIADKGNMTQVQTTNQFELLEVDDGENDADNQLALMENVDEQRSPTPNTTTAGKSLNPNAPGFIPNPAGTRVTKNGKSTIINDKGK